MRISELAALRWADVDRAANVIRLTDETTRAPRKASGERRQTKNSRSRAFPVSTELKQVLARLQPRNDGAIFHGPLGGRLKPDTVRTVLIREVLTPLADRYPSPPEDLGFKDGRLHSFRHFFCSTCANSGVPEAVVIKWLGHRDSQMVRHYYHLHDAEAQRQMQRLKFIGSTDDTVSSDSDGCGGC
jgi:integrase